MKKIKRNTKRETAEWVLISASCLLMSAVLALAAPAGKTKAATNYEAAYRPIVQEALSEVKRVAPGAYYGSRRYALYDMNRDGIKELVVEVRPDELMHYVEVYTVLNGKALKLFNSIDNGVSVADGGIYACNKGLYIAAGRMGYYEYTVLKLGKKDFKIKRVHVTEDGDPDDFAPESVGIKKVRELKWYEMTDPGWMKNPLQEGY